jgi:protoheme ferro-lyase
VHGRILPRRSWQSAHAYQTIWLPEDSPLIVTGRKAQALLQSRLEIPVELAMRFQNPSIPSAITKLISQSIEELIALPLFPNSIEDMVVFTGAARRSKSASDTTEWCPLDGTPTRN